MSVLSLYYYLKTNIIYAKFDGENITKMFYFSNSIYNVYISHVQLLKGHIYNWLTLHCTGVKAKDWLNALLALSRQMKMIIFVPGGILHHCQTSWRSSSLWTWTSSEPQRDLGLSSLSPVHVSVRRGHDSDRSGKKCLLLLYCTCVQYWWGRWAVFRDESASWLEILPVSLYDVFGVLILKLRLDFASF